MRDGDSRLHSRSAASRQHEENGARFNYKANGFMYTNVRVSRRDADLITAATPVAYARARAPLIKKFGYQPI